MNVDDEQSSPRLSSEDGSSRLFTLPAAYIHIWFSARGEDTSDFHPNKVTPRWAAAELSAFTATQRSLVWDKDYVCSEGPYSCCAVVI